MAERLGKGLQHPLERFDPAWHLQEQLNSLEREIFFVILGLDTSISETR